MSVEAMTLVLHHSKASGAAQMILMGIANHQGDGGAWPSIATLAKYGKVSERRVQQIIRELQAMGELQIYENAGGKTATGQTNLYRVVLVCPDDCDGTMNHRTQGVKSDAPRGEIWSHQGVKPISPKPVIEPVIEPINPQSKFEEAFDSFWSSYPRKVGKAEALKAFKKLRNIDEVIDGARRLAADSNLPAKEYIPHPATWLNREGWNDEPYPERTKTAEEKAAEARMKYEADRAKALEASKALKAEMEEAKAKAVPPPKCPHGVSVIICRKCLTQAVNSK